MDKLDLINEYISTMRDSYNYMFEIDKLPVQELENAINNFKSLKNEVDKENLPSDSENVLTEAKALLNMRKQMFLTKPKTKDDELLETVHELEMERLKIKSKLAEISLATMGEFIEKEIMMLDIDLYNDFIDCQKAIRTIPNSFRTSSLEERIDKENEALEIYKKALEVYLKYQDLANKVTGDLETKSERTI